MTKQTKSPHFKNHKQSEPIKNTPIEKAWVSVKIPEVELIQISKTKREILREEINKYLLIGKHKTGFLEFTDSKKRLTPRECYWIREIVRYNISWLISLADRGFCCMYMRVTGEYLNIKSIGAIFRVLNLNLKLDSSKYHSMPPAITEELPIGQKYIGLLKAYIGAQAYAQERPKWRIKLRDKWVKRYVSKHSAETRAFIVERYKLKTTDGVSIRQRLPIVPWLTPCDMLNGLTATRTTKKGKVMEINNPPKLYRFICENRKNIKPIYKKSKKSLTSDKSPVIRPQIRPY